MQKALGFVATTVLILGSISCTQQTQRQTNEAPTIATTTPAPTTPTPAPSTPNTASVKATNFEWTDEASGTNVTTIKVGGTVTFTSVGNHKLAHEPSNTVNGCDELNPTDFDSPRIVQPITRTFAKAGTFGYHCGVHGGTANCKNPGDSDGMSAVIKVVP